MPSQQSKADCTLVTHRLEAIIVLIEFRQRIGLESKQTVKTWKAVQIRKQDNRDEDARKLDPVLLTLEKRRDQEFLATLKNYQDYRAAMLRFFENTVQLPKYGSRS